MKTKYGIGLAVFIFLFSSCGDDGESYVPGAPTFKVDVTKKTLTWNSIAGASSYNLYIKTVKSCPDIDTAEFQTPTKNDKKVTGVTSPYSIANYDGCTTCYYAALAAANNVGEGTLSRAKGWQIRTCP